MLSPPLATVTDVTPKSPAAAAVDACAPAARARSATTSLYRPSPSGTSPKSHVRSSGNTVSPSDARRESPTSRATPAYCPAQISQRLGRPLLRDERLSIASTTMSSRLVPTNNTMDAAMVAISRSTGLHVVSWQTTESGRGAAVEALHRPLPSRVVEHHLFEPPAG